MQEAVLPPWVCWKHLYASVVGIEPRQSYSSVGQSATLIMWRSAVQVCLGLRKFEGDQLSWLEHLLCKQGVNGSNPLFSTISPFIMG